MSNAGIKNWHWRSKGVEPWAKAWFETNLTGIEADGVSIASVTDVEGDAELGMRKSKLVTIYDEKITMVWKATDSAGEAVNGTLVAIEVSHDMDEDEYVFTSTLDTASSPEANKLHAIAKKALANKLRAKFQEFPKALIATHGKDLLADESDSTPASGATTPSVAPAASTVPSMSNLSLSTPSTAPTTSKTTGIDGKTFNTAIAKAEGEFMCSADDLFDFLTNEAKIPLWSRNPAKMKPEVGAEVSMFGGNIAGKVEAVERPTSITTSWRAPTWPDGYYGTLETTLSQGSSSTTLTLRLSGVPVGKEDEAERNLSIYYINGLKNIGSVLPPLSPSSPFPTPVAKRRQKPKVAPPSRWSLVLTSAVPMTISLGLIAALGAAFYYGPSGPGRA